MAQGAAAAMSDSGVSEGALEVSGSRPPATLQDQRIPTDSTSGVKGSGFGMI